MQNLKRYYDSIYFLEVLSNLPIENNYMLKSKNPGIYLKRMRYFLNLIDNPDINQKFIHITGTAGKGSVTNMIHEILYASGRNVGSFTSPFVTTSIEKIKVNDKYISPDQFANIVDYLKPFINKAYLECPYGRPSYFEIFLAIAFIYFKQMKCEFIVLEAGLGGRYDATNVINKPTITAITNIDYDHIEVLGKTLKEIAKDKAGIIKSGSKFFTGENRKPILKIFEEICHLKSVNMIKVPKQFDYNYNNQMLAKSICKYIKIEDKYIQKGIINAKLQCRFEIMQNKPLLIIDGAHNRSKIKSTLDNLKKLKYNKLHLIIGMADSKDSDSILSQIVPIADNIIFTRFQIKDRKCAHPTKLAKISKKYLKTSTKIVTELDPNLAYDKAIQIASNNDAILVTGSFFLAGEIRKKWYSEEWVVRNRIGFK